MFIVRQLHLYILHLLNFMILPSQIDGVSGETLSYSEVNSMIRKLSHGWKAAGLKADEVVFLVTPNCILVPPVFLAAATIGAPVTLANPLNTPGK